MPYTYSKAKRKGRKSIQSKKTEVDGIKFASSLEAYMYRALKKAKIKAEYEGEEFILQEGFTFEADSIERSGKRDYQNKGGKKTLPIKYTPDFVAEDFIIECKGRANESFPLRWKMFKKLMQETRPGVDLYKPQNQGDCDKTIELILDKRKKK